jgi:hypothetical protein
MIKRSLYAIVVCGVVACLIGLCLAASQGLDDALGRYPGSMLIATENVDFHTLTKGTLQRQATYQTRDKLAFVRQWYAARLQISPASDQNNVASDGSVWLTHMDQFIHIQYTVSVLLYPVPAGTRVVVSESLSLEP